MKSEIFSTNKETENPEKSEFFHDILIQGSKDFVARTKKVLSLLFEQSESFSTVSPYLGRIRQSARSGMRAYDLIPTFDVSDSTSGHSLIWYAGAIAHDAYHSLLYHRNKEIEGKEPEYDKWTGDMAEKMCLKFQLQVLNELSADDSFIDYIKGMLDNPTYHGNSKSWRDYEKRQW